MATFIALLIPVTIQHNAMWNQPIALRQRKLFERKFVCFVVVVFSCFFYGGGRGLGLGLLFFWGGGIQRNATLTQSIALRSAIVGRENLIAGGLFVFFFFVCLFFGFILFLLFFGGGGWLSLFGGGIRGIDYPNYAPSTVSQKILAQFRFWFVLLFVVV